MKKPFIHVVHKQNNWAVEREGEDEVLQSFDTKEEAVARGREVARKEEVELIIHRQDGSISERDSYGNDPRNIPG